MQHRCVVDRTQRDIANVLQRPPGIVVRRWIVRPVVLFAEVALRERPIRLIERHDVVTRRDVRTAGLERLIRASHLDSVKAEQVHEIRRLDRPRLARGNDERVRSVLGVPPLHSPHTLAIELVQIAMPIARHVVQRDEQSRLLVIDVVANAPPHAVERRVGPEPFDRGLTIGKLHGVTVGSARGVRLVESADRVVPVCHPEHVVGSPAVVEIMGPHAGEPATRQRRDLLERELVPLADDDGVELPVV